MNYATDRSASTVVTLVLDFIHHRRDRAVNVVCGDYPDDGGYRESWVVLDDHAFWARLDYSNRMSIISAARDFYLAETMQD